MWLGSFSLPRVDWGLGEGVTGLQDHFSVFWTPKIECEVQEFLNPKCNYMVMQP